MKKNFTLVVLTIFLAFNSLAQKKYFAEVYVVNGVEAYILNEPVRPYEIFMVKAKVLTGQVI